MLTCMHVTLLLLTNVAQAGDGDTRSEPVEDKPDDSSKKTDEATKVQWWHHSRICAARCECNSVVKYTDEMTVMTVRGL